MTSPAVSVPVEATHFQDLVQLIEEKAATIGIIGLGYVGLPLAHTINASGFRVVGYDIDEKKINKLKEGVTYIKHVKGDIAADLKASHHFTPTVDFSTLVECDVLIMCLPTPVGPHNEPDMSYVLQTSRGIRQQLRKGQLIILESTTYPGATETDIVDVLRVSGLKLGLEYFVAFSPEREDPGNAKFSTATIPKLVGGVDEASGRLADHFYRQGGFERTVRVSHARVAECAKLLENTYRAVNIALVNELKTVFESMGVNIWEVLDAASTKPFGYHRFEPGPGIGGHCIPVDPFYLTWRAKETGAPCDFIELAATVNAAMPGKVVERVQWALNGEKRSVNGSRVLLLGIAYKANVDDMREAPALVIWEKLLDLGAEVLFYDPLVPVVCQTRKHGRLSQQRSIDLHAGATIGQQADAVILVTAHECFGDYSFLTGFQGPVVDTRNQIPSSLGVKVVRA